MDLLINAVLHLQISDDTIEKLRQIFLSLDDDNSGTLSARELSSFGNVNIFESSVCTTTLACHRFSVIDHNGIGLQFFTSQELYIGVQWFFRHAVVPPAEVEEIDEALERLEVEEPIRVEMRCEISGW